MILLLLPPASPYRVTDSNTSSLPFLPYERGFVGLSGLPQNYLRERVNEGGPETQAYPHQMEGVNARQECKGMVGPVEGLYYCGARERGYCDRRSGTCFCQMGYQGESCEEVSELK